MPIQSSSAWTTRRVAGGILARCRVSVAIALILAITRVGAASAQGECPQPEIQKNPESCKSLWEGIGLPLSNKDDDADAFTYVCHEKFLVRHNNETKTPDWVIERLTADQVAKELSRPDQAFKPDTCLPSSGQAIDNNYRLSLYARGHQAASADFSVNEKWMRDTFVFSNAVPQEGAGFNSSIWSQLEAKVRDLARDRGEIYVITGPIYQNPNGKEIVVSEEQNPCGREIRLPVLDRKEICGGSKAAGPTLSCTEGVAIPAGLFKVIVDPGLGRVNAYLLPNIDHPSRKERGTSTDEYLATWRVSVLNLEDRAGYTFLPGLSRHERKAQVEACPATMFH
jgi:DNA/RNA endonuclease G (NUC1)